MDDDDFDILVIGGGMAGASLACALRELRWRVGVVEALPPGGDAMPGRGTRAIALAAGSKRIFEAMGVWSALIEQAVTPIRHIHISDRGHFGTARLVAEDEGVDALGYVVEAGVIGRALLEAVESLPHTELISPAQLVAANVDTQGVHVTLEQMGKRRCCRCRLLVAADGERSRVRELLGARTFQVAYGQTALTANVVTEREHCETAYERFTDSGPLALLPSRALAGTPEAIEGDRRWSLVWSAHNHQVKALLGMADRPFLKRLQERFGRRVGRFVSISPRHAYPLAMRYVYNHVHHRVAFIGNAAHTIHPVGGQGFNLGLRDVVTLADVLAAAEERGADPGAQDTLRGYASWRRADHLRTIGLSDALVRTFSSRCKPLAWARDSALMGLDLAPAARHAFARQCMGFSGYLPRLALGLPLKRPTESPGT